MNTQFYRTPENVTSCFRCNLSTGKSVQSHCQVSFDKALLAIYGTYPDSYEENTGLSLNSNSTGNNAGAFLARTISTVFDGYSKSLSLNKYKPFNKYIIYGNVIRRNPYSDKKNPKKILDTNLKKCNYWLNRDIGEMSPKIPIVLSGTEAVKAFIDKSGSVTKYKNEINLKYKDHPVVVIPNLVLGAKSDNYIINPNNGLPNQPKRLIDRPIFGSLSYFLKRDFYLIRELVIQYIEEMEKNEANK